MLTRMLRTLFGSVLLTAFSSLGGCGSGADSAGAGGGSTSTGASITACSNDPFSCGEDRTCVPFSNDGTFVCLPSGDGEQGSPCESVYNTAPCAPGLTCVALADPRDGTCVPFCDKARPCPDGVQCLTQLTVDDAPAPSACDPSGYTGSGQGGYGEGGFDEGGFGGDFGGFGGAGGFGGVGGF